VSKDAAKSVEEDDLMTVDQDPASLKHKQQQRQVWQSNLEQLSGGQRTLISLALLLAIANTGCSNSQLLLLDEVDAALDEHNTCRLAELLHQLAHAPAAQDEEQGKLRRKGQQGSMGAAARGGGCQILCVSHNKAFQGSCDGLLHVGRNNNSAVEQDNKGGEKACGGDHSKKPKGRKHGMGPSAGDSLGKSNTRKVRFSVK
jgi:hypothetical protein